MGINTMNYSTLTISGTSQDIATACNPVMPTTAKGAVIVVEGGDTRVREDGTAPTSTEGVLVEFGDSMVYDSWTVPKANWRSVLKNLKVINAGAAVGELKIHWYD